MAQSPQGAGDLPGWQYSVCCHTSLLGGPGAALSSPGTGQQEALHWNPPGLSCLISDFNLCPLTVKKNTNMRITAFSEFCESF